MGFGLRIMLLREYFYQQNVSREKFRFTFVATVVSLSIINYIGKWDPESRVPNMASFARKKCQKVPDKPVPLMMCLQARTSKQNPSVLGLNPGKSCGKEMPTVLGQTSPIADALPS